MTQKILWKGSWRSDVDIDEAVAQLETEINESLGAFFSPEILINACHRLSCKVKESPPDTWINALTDIGQTRSQAIDSISAISGFMSKDHLEEKYRRELGDLDPFSLKRPHFSQPVFESWAPLGVLFHIVPGNSPVVGPLAVVEGLMAGNINILKNTAQNGIFPFLVLSDLVAMDPTGMIARLVYAFQFSSSEQDILKSIYQLSDGVSAWGGDAAIEAVRNSLPTTVKLIDWGHKISFSYVTPDAPDLKEVMNRISHDICVVNQQACSSPQCLFVDSELPSDIDRIAELLAESMARLSDSYPLPHLSVAEIAELTTTTEMAGYDACMGSGKNIVDKDHAWRLLVQYEPGMKPSPLNRTLWIAPMPRRRITTILSPYRTYLQTAGLACTDNDIYELTTTLIAAGANRVVAPGQMISEYPGQPHDGVYALQRFSRRVSMSLPERHITAASFRDHFSGVSVKPDAPVMDKAGFIEQVPDPDKSQLFFRSGGTTGSPKVSIYSYNDYSEQMAAISEGLFAAGLRPKTDRCANLMHCGNLYGGFVSFWSILEHMEATQFPIGHLGDLETVVDLIIQFKIDTLLGMPFYIQQLLTNYGDKLKAYGGIKKLFLGGEHISDELRLMCEDEFNIPLVVSAIYGSNDAGPIGYACSHCRSGEFHVLSRTQTLEIIDMEKDVPVQEGDAGRLIVTSTKRSAQSIMRYDIGDMGQWLPKGCGCGRNAPKFRLLGRHGDIFKLGPLFNLKSFSDALSQACGYSGVFQLYICKGDDGLDELHIRIDRDSSMDTDSMYNAIFSHMPLLGEIIDDKVARLYIDSIDVSAFETVPQTGKLRSIVDSRN